MMDPSESSPVEDAADQLLAGKHAANGIQRQFTLLICDDDPMVLEALCEQLESGKSPFGTEVVVLSCEHPDVALRLADQSAPDLILMDLYHFGSHFGGITALCRLASILPQARRVAITAHGPNITDSDLKRLHTSEIHGFIDKRQGVLGVLGRAYQIACGSPWFEPLIESRFARLTAASAPGPELLSEREMQVLLLRARGIRVRLIASELRIEPPSVYTFLNRIQLKLGIKEPAELYAFCVRHGLIRL